MTKRRFQKSLDMYMTLAVMLINLQWLGGHALYRCVIFTKMKKTKLWTEFLANIALIVYNMQIIILKEIGNSHEMKPNFCEMMQYEMHKCAERHKKFIAAGFFKGFRRMEWLQKYHDGSHSCASEHRSGRSMQLHLVQASATLSHDLPALLPSYE